MQFTAFLVLLAIALAQSSKDYHYSLRHLKEAYQKEADLLNYLKEYNSEFQRHLDKIKKDIRKIKSEHEIAEKDVDNYFRNPFNSFHIIKRIFVDYKEFHQEISENKIFENFKHEANKIIITEEYPTDEDLLSSAMSIARIQETYNIQTSELASGLIAGVKIADSMSWKRTQEWMKEALTKFYPKLKSDTDSIDILEQMANITVNIRDVETTLNITETILKVQPDNLVARSANVLMKSLPNNFKEMIPKHENKSNRLTPETFRTYEAVCRDEIKQTPQQTKDLFCSYASNDNPFLKLAPFKLEVISLEPNIVIYHDVLYNSEIDFFKTKALPFITRSKTGATSVTYGRTSDLRTSHGTFVHYKGVPQLENLIKRVEDMTRLSIEGIPQVQVSNYGMGGHYGPHYDCFGDKLSQTPYNEEGDRISTAMFYASDVEFGGSTAFPKLRLNVKPRKGSMVFWYNLHTSGKKDFRSLHAGCPVIKGSKWSM
uniref:procollagen-proline 4-dioxygenase n=2 Tax=Eukaryota TaxID=2759 RepID=T1GCC6_MEGSC